MARLFGFTLTLLAITISIYADENELLRHLKRANKHALKSFKSEDGDIIDCVHITNQPAFDHPLLKNHIIQMRPSSYPESDSTYTKKETRTITQIWHKSGEYCPKDTVPIRRTKKEDILRAKSNKSYRKKVPRAMASIPAEFVDKSIGHEYAIMSSREGLFSGTQFAVNVWNPFVQAYGEFSLSQTWLVSGSGPNLNSIEAGWQVSQQIYGDNNTRLFIFWTADGYQGKLCYNSDCPNHGFVQTTNVLALGGAIKPVSQYDGQQTEISILIWKDVDQKWWLKVGEEIVGYWPGELFTSLGNGATKVQWGGEIVNIRTDGKHTSTDMGSGSFPEEGFKKASYFRNLMMVDETNTLVEPQGLFTYASNDTCYNVMVGDVGTTWGSNFYYGGSGFNENCP